MTNQQPKSHLLPLAVLSLLVCLGSSLEVTGQTVTQSHSQPQPRLVDALPHYSTNPATDGLFRKIRVDVRGITGAQVSAREGYKTIPR